MPIRKIIFMGNSQPNSTEADILKMYRKLGKGLDILGYLQQPPHTTSEKEAKQAEIEYKVLNDQLLEIAKDLVMGLTGKYIKFL